MEKESQATSDKGQKLKNYSLKFKLDAISFAAIHGNHAAEKKYNVDRKRIREWREKKESIEKTVKSKKAKGCQRKRVEGGGRKPFSEKLEGTVFEWVHERRSKGLRVSRKLIMKKAEVLYDDMMKNGEPDEPFKASTGWFRGFMKHYGLSLRQKTPMAQKDSNHVIDKLVAFVLHVRRVSMKHPYDATDIIAMHKIPVWSDMVSETTVDATRKKPFSIKITGHEKSHVLVCLAAKANGTKLPPFMFSKGQNEKLLHWIKKLKIVT